MSGSGCPDGHVASASILPSNPKDYPAIFGTYLSTGGSGIETLLEDSGSSTRVTSGPNDRWTINAMVPMVLPGPSIITGSCRPALSTTDPAAGFLYRPRHVSVSTPYTLSVTPGATVIPGSTLTIQPNGGGCSAPAVTPIVALYQETGAIRVLTTTMGETHPETYWQANLVVPLHARPGHYQLEADCDYSRGAIYGSYAPRHITVK